MWPLSRLCCQFRTRKRKREHGDVRRKSVEHARKKQVVNKLMKVKMVMAIVIVEVVVVVEN